MGHILTADHLREEHSTLRRVPYPAPGSVLLLLFSSRTQIIIAGGGKRPWNLKGGGEGRWSERYDGGGGVSV